MLRKSDFLLLIVVFASMGGGIFCPSLGRAFQPYPLFLMMFLLFLSFLSIELSRVRMVLRKRWKAAAWLVGLKILVLPLAVYYGARLIFPSFAPGALLLTGVSTGVVAPFIATLVQSNVSLVLLVVVMTSLFVPFTLPVLVKCLLGKTMTISLFSMMEILGLVIFVPLIAVEAIRRWFPSFEKVLLNVRYPVSLVVFAAINLGVFSKYSLYFHQQPTTIVGALSVALLLGAFYLAVGLISLRKGKKEDRIASAIVFGNMNNVLIIVFASRFFGPLEATLAAMYMIPFFALIFPLRIYERIDFLPS